MADYILTQHAKDRIDKRRIAMELIDQAINSPDMVIADQHDADLEHRIVLVPEGTPLRVVCSKSDPVRVVTVFPDRRLQGTNEN